MKKILLITSFFTVLVVIFTSCLKDKEFDKGLYGINNPGGQPPGVGFPLGVGVKPRNSYGLNAASTTLQVANGLVYVNLESGLPAPADIHITLALNNSVIGRYNADPFSPDIDTLSPVLYNIPTLSLTIPAGQRNVQVPINIPNTTSLNPLKTYGVGLTITSVDGGYVIAENLKDLLIAFGLKNKYDGKWNLKGWHNRAPYTFPYDVTVEMWTTGPASVAMWFPADGDYAQPIGVAPGVADSYGSAVSPNFQFDPITNLCTGVSLQVGAAVTLAMVTSDPVIGTIINRYEPGTKKMYLTFQYNGNPLRRFYDTLTYIGPR